jgi:hypothetical protein
MGWVAEESGFDCRQKQEVYLYLQSVQIFYVALRTSMQWVQQDLTQGVNLQRLRIDDVGFEVLTPVVMNSSVFWDITPCSPLKVNRRLRGTYRLHLQGLRITEQEHRVKAGGKQNKRHAEI